MNTEHTKAAASARPPSTPSTTLAPTLRRMAGTASEATPIGPTRTSLELDRFDHRSPGPDLTAALRAAQQGDEDSFGLIYDDLQPRLLRYLHVLVNTDAEDVASETWLQIGRDLRTFHGDWRQCRNWAVTIARHRALDHIRSQRRRPTAETTLDQVIDREGTENTEAAALDRIACDAALALVASLPRREAEAVLLRTLIGLTATEAARVLDTEPGAVRSAAHRGLRKLAGRVGPDGL